jgi:putative hydrolase of the HAD superfamily
MPPTLTILDLGGVLFNIDFERTRTAFRACEGYNGTPILFGVEDQDPLFVAYDRGDVSTAAFRDALRERYGFTCSDGEIDRAWNAILDAGLFPFAPDLVRSIRTRYCQGAGDRLVIFSNISELHHLNAQERCRPVFDRVDHVYLSYVERVRKPDPEAFLHVCRAEGFAPQHTRLIDDSRANCAAAAALGIDVIHVTDPQEL